LIDDAFGGASGIIAGPVARLTLPGSAVVRPFEQTPACRSAPTSACLPHVDLGERMRLTTFTDYTLRTLIYLAVRPGTIVTISDVANAYGISANHLMKVVHRLALTGDIATTRGQRGGLRLARNPDAINIGDVVRRTEPDMALVACFGETSHCTIEEGCVLRHALDAALQAFLAVLDRYTLADLVEPRQTLAALLGVEPQPERQIMRPQ
jgi:Rrf2 family transcriptional regulator, nitric oxide-sensitive transcriptional repressor